jgi:hypothetical protein
MSLAFDTDVSIVMLEFWHAESNRRLWSLFLVVALALRGLQLFWNISAFVRLRLGYGFCPASYLARELFWICGAYFS